MSNFVRKYIHLLFAVVSSLLVFLINGFEYFSNIYYPPIYYAKEILLIISLLFSTFFWNRLEEKKTDIQYMLKNILGITIVFFALIMVKKFLFTNELYSDFFPQKAISIPGLLLSGIFSFFIIFLLPAIIIILKNLFLYKRKKFTPTYFYVYIIFAIISALIISINQDPNSAQIEDSFDFNKIINSITLGYSFILSFRHSWIIYLSKKQKFSYAAFSVLLIPAIAFLFEFIQVPLISFSIFLHSFSNIILFFLTFYAINSMVFMWLQLPTANVFEKKMKDLDLIHRSSQKLNQMVAGQNLYREIIKTISDILKADDVWLEMLSNNNPASKFYSLRSTDKSLYDFIKYSQHPKISNSIVESKSSILVADLKNHSVYKPYYNWKNDLRCLIAVPFFSAQKEIMGILYLIQEQPYAFDISDLAIVESYAYQASLFMENSRLLDETLKQERFKQELKIAREVQLNLLPKNLPHFNNIEISAESLTAYEVGGDFYDFFQYKDGQYGFVLGDVSGKGTQAAFYMAEFKGIIQSLASTCNSPKELAMLSNKILFPNIETKSFITAIITKFDQKNEKLLFVRAGHSNPLYFNTSDQSHKDLQTDGIGMGLDKGPIFNKTIAEYTIPYQKNHLVFFYTDGLSELMDHKNRELPFDEIIKIFRNHHHDDTENIKEAILNKTFDFLKGGTISDDLTFVIIKFK